MHNVVRKLCMDYMSKNSDHFSQFVTEDFNDYVRRKRNEHEHGNHVEMQVDLNTLDSALLNCVI